MEKYTLKQRNDVYEKALKKYGYTPQVLMLLEEMAELGKEVCKCTRFQGDKEKVIDEMADVLIMIEQIQKMFGIEFSSVEERMFFKLERLERRMENG